VTSLLQCARNRGDRPLRAVEDAAEWTTARFDTAPAKQSQIDWGQSLTHFGHLSVPQPLILTRASRRCNSRPTNESR
jgi:hypothetical protein